MPRTSQPNTPVVANLLGANVAPVLGAQEHWESARDSDPAYGVGGPISRPGRNSTGE
jgi:hypothetical protein